MCKQMYMTYFLLKGTKQIVVISMIEWIEKHAESMHIHPHICSSEDNV